MKKILSVALICSMLLAFLSGCSYFDKLVGGDSDDSIGDDGGKNDNGDKSQNTERRYTGGLVADPKWHGIYGVYWLETYEEVLEAIELLASHGSTVENKDYGNTVKRSIGFNCEGDFLDIKWCFMYSRSKAEPLEEGKNFFDRRIDEGEFKWYAFHEDVTIDKLIYSYREEYGSFGIRSYPHKSSTPVKYNYVVNVENVGDLSLEWFGRYDYGVADHPLDGSYYEIMYQGELVAEMEYNSDYPLPIDYHEEFLSTMVVIE